MSETKHTAGPWVAIRSIPEEGCDGWWIKAQPHAAMRGFTNDLAWVNGGQENEANARLIAAAPTLLSIAKRWAALDGGRWLQERYAREKAELLADTAAAIAKAEGRS